MIDNIFLVSEDLLNASMYAIMGNSDEQLIKTETLESLANNFLQKSQDKMAEQLVVGVTTIATNGYQLDDCFLSFEGAVETVVACFSVNHLEADRDKLAAYLNTGKRISFYKRETINGLLKTPLDDFYTFSIVSIHVFKWHESYVVTPIFCEEMWLWEGIHAKKLGAVLESGVISSSKEFVDCFRVYSRLYDGYLGGTRYEDEAGNDQRLVDDKLAVLDRCCDKAESFELKKNIKINKALLSYMYADKGKALYTRDGHVDYNDTVKFIYDVFDDSICRALINKHDILCLYMVRFLIAVSHKN